MSESAQHPLARLHAAGQLERDGVAAFAKAFANLLAVIETRAGSWRPEG